MTLGVRTHVVKGTPLHCCWVYQLVATHFLECYWMTRLKDLHSCYQFCKCSWSGRCRHLPGDVAVKQKNIASSGASVRGGADILGRRQNSNVIRTPKWARVLWREPRGDGEASWQLGLHHRQREGQNGAPRLGEVSAGKRPWMDQGGMAVLDQVGVRGVAWRSSREPRVCLGRSVLGDLLCVAQD